MATGTQPAREAKLSGSVRITLPISVAYDLEKFQKVLANIARQVGCEACTSGVDITFLTARNWIVDPATLQINEVVSESGAVVR